MNSDRIHYIDTAKGIGILFVVIAHHLLGGDALRGWINSFHMPMFFMFTGFLMAHRNKTYKDDRQMIKEKAEHLLYPYFTFSILILVWYFVFYIILSNKPDEPLRYVLIKMVTTYGYHALWFLPALFFSTLLFLFINKSQKSNLMFIILIIVGGILGVFINIPITKKNLFGWYILNYFTRIIIATGFIYLGSIWKFVDEKIQNKKIEWVLIIVAFLCSVSLQYFNFNEVNLSSSRIGNPFLFYVLAVAGSVFIILLCKKLNLHSGILNFWGQNSLIIMAVHMDFPVAIAWIVVGKSGLSTSLSQLGASGIVIIIELIVESACIVLINKFLGFMITYRRGNIKT